MKKVIYKCDNCNKEVDKEHYLQEVKLIVGSYSIFEEEWCSDYREEHGLNNNKVCLDMLKKLIPWRD